MSSTKRAWKLQEFVAHGSNVNCLALGHKSGHVMVTGGEDKKVNMWTVGKPNCIMSLTGHTSPVEAVRFGNAEEIVVAGSLSGALKIWDLEAAKIVRTLTGHKSNIRSLDFHPYGDFVASGSLDTNIKIWDIRRKGCIYTYKGHTNCVNSLRFSPDGRWIASAGEDGLLKLWDLTAGKTLTDLKGHTGPVTSVEFHPHDFLLASGSADRTVQFWDLESFQLVSRTDGDSTGIRTICFHPDGLCLYSGASDVLKSYSWEPARCFDSIAMGWGRVADISIAQNQLIGATFSQTNVSTFVVDLQKVQPVGGSEPLSPPNSSRGRRSFCIERPPTQSSKRIEPKEAPEEAITPAGDDDDDSNSYAQIQDQDDYHQIFRPKHNLAYEASPARVKPFPAPAEERDRPSPGRPVHQTPPERDPPVTTRRETPPSKPTLTKPTSANTHREPSREKTPRERPGPREPSREKPPPSRGGVGGGAASAAGDRGRDRYVPGSVPADRDQPVGLDMDDFLPKAATPNLADAHLPSEMSEAEAISAIMRGHDSMAAVLTSRHKNLQIIRALWTGGNIKTAIDSAISMRDQAVMVDVFNIIVQKPALWSLDMCGLLLPTIKDLLSSKYETYVSTGCNALKVVLKNFAPVIKANMTAPPSIGVDISREERYNKCQQCYGVLMNIRPIIDTKHPMYNKLASKFRELNLLLSQLD